MFSTISCSSSSSSFPLTVNFLIPYPRPSYLHTDHWKRKFWKRRKHVKHLLSERRLSSRLHTLRAWCANAELREIKFYLYFRLFSVCVHIVKREYIISRQYYCTWNQKELAWFAIWRIHYSLEIEEGTFYKLFHYSFKFSSLRLEKLLKFLT